MKVVEIINDGCFIRLDYDNGDSQSINKDDVKFSINDDTVFVSDNSGYFQDVYFEDLTAPVEGTAQDLLATLEGYANSSPCSGGGGGFTCDDVDACLGIDRGAGDPTLFLNEAGDFVPVGGVVPDTVTTIDATETELSSIATIADTVIGVCATITAKQTGGTDGAVGDGYYGELYGAFKNISGTLTQIENTTKKEYASSQRAVDENPVWNMKFDISGTDIKVMVIGAVDQTIDWTDKIELTII